ncbi:TIM barrel protein [bacterium]|nr:TIM barrel protein [bacterium]
MFGISTAWCSGRLNDGVELLSQISQTGLNHLEIDYRVTAEMLRQMRPQLMNGEFTVLSVHNYCPLPDGRSREEASRLFPPSTFDADERRLAIRHSIRTVQLAADLGASIVVFHLGQVEMVRNLGELKELFFQEQIHSAQAEAWREANLAERGRLAARHMDAVLFTLDPIHEEACRLGVNVGVENRLRFNEIPFGDECEQILSAFHGGRLRYWHDCGHAEINHRLGFLDHEKDLLARYLEHLAGFHLHDVLKLKDHLAPAQGDMDFRMLKPYISDSTINILEIHHPATAEQIRAGVEYLQGLGIS